MNTTINLRNVNKCLLALFGAAFMFHSCQKNEIFFFPNELLINPETVSQQDLYFNVPDANFEQALIDLAIDDVLDGKALKSNAESVVSLDVENRNISDLTGIAYFLNLSSLNCSDNHLVSLDLSKNTLLKILKCYDNKLEFLDVSNSHALINLMCNRNSLKSLDVHKTSTATIQSGGIGSTVNVNTARPFAISGFKVAGSIKAVYDSNSEETTPQFSGLLSNTFNYTNILQ